MALWEIIVAAVLVLVALVFVGGLLGARRRDQLRAGRFQSFVQEADRALQQARASDRGWAREVMEEACRRALSEQRPGFTVNEMHLVLVDDKPGVDEDRAHFVAVGSDGELKVVLARSGEHWGAELVE
jgi:type II secretory pathway pseudopilin PulG